MRTERSSLWRGLPVLLGSLGMAAGMLGIGSSATSNQALAAYTSCDMCSDDHQDTGIAYYCATIQADGAMYCEIGGLGGGGIYCSNIGNCTYATIDPTNPYEDESGDGDT